MKQILYIWLLLLPAFAAAQSTVTVQVEDKEESEPIQDAIVNIERTNITGYTDSNGVAVLFSVPDTAQHIIVSYLGYYRKKVKLSPGTSKIEVKLEEQEEELDEVVVVTTRNDKRNTELPTRIEVITEEEVEERSHDKPSDVSHVVREQAGIQVQRTSATAGTMSIRLQGLRGRYAQVLKDGVPLFGGFSNVIGVTQIPPLDITQVEIIKGPASTLYGGDAIAGVVNFITRKPSEKPIYDIMVNAEAARAVDVGSFAAQKFKWFGFSLTGMYRYQREKDWNGDNFTETPKLQRYIISPQLYFDITDKVKLNIGASYTNEDRLGGAIPYILGKDDSVYTYYEKNQTEHVSSNFKFEYNFGKGGKLTLKNAVNYFTRQMSLPYYYFDGTQLGTASELNYHVVIKQKHDAVIGVDFRSDRVKENADSAKVDRGYDYSTFGFFANYIFSPTEKTSLEAGVRVDYNTKYGVYGLPHIAIKHVWSEVFVTRLNGGMGYKLPTIYQDESEQVRFVNVLPIHDSIRPEISIGATGDLLVKAPSINGFNISVNQMYFITHIFRPMLAHVRNIGGCPGGDCQELNYVNGNGWQQSKGVETSLKMSYRGANLNVYYTLTDNNVKINGVRGIAPLTSKHIVSFFAGYESKRFGIGIDCYYFSPVKLSDGSVGRRMWELGINGQVNFRYVLIFANLENILDMRQTTYGPIVQPSPTYATPRFKEIYAPLEGRFFNAGIKVRLGEFSKKNKPNDEGVEKIR